MYFITEAELRLHYQQEHFTDYTIKQGTRLTPEARQFLLDRKIVFLEQKQQKSQLSNVSKSKAPKYTSISSYLKPKLEKISATFLLVVSFLTDEDMYTAEQVLILENYLADLCNKNDEHPRVTVDLSLKTEKKHVVSAFHIQSSKGKEIAFLNFLLVDLKVFRAELMTNWSEKTGMEEQLNLIIEKVDKVCTVLEGLIHKAIGGDDVSEGK